MTCSTLLYICTYAFIQVHNLTPFVAAPRDDDLHHEELRMQELDLHDPLPGYHRVQLHPPPQGHEPPGPRQQGQERFAPDTSSVIIVDELMESSDIIETAKEPEASEDAAATKEVESQEPQEASSAALQHSSNAAHGMVHESLAPLPTFDEQEIAINDKRIKMLSDKHASGIMVKALNCYTDSKPTFLGFSWNSQEKRTKGCSACQRCNPHQHIPKNCIWQLSESKFHHETSSTFLEAKAYPASQDLPFFAEFYERPPNSHIVEARNLLVADMSLCVLVRGHVFHIQPGFSGSLDRASTQSWILSLLQQECLKVEMFLTPLQLAVYTMTREGSFQYQNLTPQHIHPYTYLAGVQCHKVIVTAVITHCHVWSPSQYVDYCIRHNVGRPQEHHVLSVPGYVATGIFPEVNMPKAARYHPKDHVKNSKARRKLNYDNPGGFQTPPSANKKTAAEIAGLYLNLTGARSRMSPPASHGPITAAARYPQGFFFTPGATSSPRTSPENPPQAVSTSPIQQEK